MPTFWPEEWSRRRSSRLTPISPISVRSRAICPGVSSTRTVSHEYACGGPPCLPGMRDWPALPSLISWRGPAARREPRGFQGADKPVRGPRGRRAGSRPPSGVGAQDLHPQRGIARGDPGDIPQPVAGQGQCVQRRALQPAGDQRGHDLRQVGHQRHGFVVFVGGEFCNDGAEVAGQRTGHPQGLRQSLFRGHTTHGMEVNSSPRAATGPDFFPAGHGMRPHVAARSAPRRRRSARISGLDAGDVHHDGGG